MMMNRSNTVFSTTLRRAILLVICLLHSATSISAAEISVQSHKGEKWWGLHVGNSPEQPFLQPFTATVGQSSGEGFTTPVLLSSLGRFIYCRPATEVRFDGSVFRLRYRDDKPYVAEVGRTLRDAYRMLCFKYFPPENIAPPQEFYDLPLYDTSLEFGSLPSQERIVAYAERLVGEGFPRGIVLVGDGWSELPGAYTFFAGAFPDPRAMVERLHALGFKVMLTLTPYAAVSGRTFVENMQRGFLLQNPGKGPVVVHQDGGYYSVYDLAGERQVEHLRAAVKRLVADYGIDGVRFDCARLLPSLTPTQASRLMARWIEIGSDIPLTEYFPGADKPFTPYANVLADTSLKARSGQIAGQLNKLTSASLSGFYGYRPMPCMPADTAELFAREWLMVRTLQLQAISALPTVGFAPWRITDRSAYETVKKCLQWRASLAPYMSGVRRECMLGGEPIVRPMEYMFPRSGFSDCNDQFMLGGRYLCAPFCDSEPRRLVRLPRGIWVDRRGERFKGPLVLTVKQSDNFAPIFELMSK
ncbi:glycoside hydrolase [Bacteroidia bacterium]|nr:glycoside hydrolase [Bacteroidia bacterium]